MSSPSEYFGHRNPVGPLICCDVLARIGRVLLVLGVNELVLARQLRSEGHMLDDGHLLVVELDEVVNDEVVATLEDLNGSHCGLHTGVEDLGVLRSHVEENVLVFFFLL